MKSPSAETSQTLAFAVAESFTEDIVIEILSRLPIKSLIRFKCVSKRWQCLISDGGFAKLHLQRLKEGDITPSQRIVKNGILETIHYELLDGGIGGDEGSAVVKLHEPRMDDPTWEPDLVGSCDGLVCLAVQDRFLLYNPTTEESRDFPSSDLVTGDDFFHGFGYDSTSDDYKIVQGTGSTKCQVGIFSIKSGSWRRIQVHQESHLAVYDRGVYWNGALHWCVTDERNKKETIIISFDLSEEKFHQMLSVPEVEGGIIFEGLGIHGANLFIYHGTLEDRFEAWITNEYGRGGSWTKLFSVSTEGLPGGEFWQIPVAYTRSGKIVFQIDVYQIILYDPEDNTYQDYPIQSNDNLESAIYVETLISPYLGSESPRI
ncbi:F-box domain-containing protein [Psidium guajava]|nr:F-box domain-containing protein [Psidium guajava]